MQIKNNQSESALFIYMRVPKALDSLHITETQDLIDWMKSTITISNYSESDFDKLYDYFENIRIKQGSIDIS